MIKQNALAAACSQRIAGSVPKELQCVFSIAPSPPPLTTLPTPANSSPVSRGSVPLRNIEIPVDRPVEVATVSPTSLRRDSRTAGIAHDPKEVEVFDAPGSLDPVESTSAPNPFQIDPNLDWAFSPSSFAFDIDVPAVSGGSAIFEDESTQPLSPSQSVIREPNFGNYGGSTAKDTPDPGSSNPASTTKANSPGRTTTCIQQGRCYGEASDLLEQLEARKHDTSNNWIDGLLAFQKTIVSKCDELFTCSHCSSQSSFVMLLLYISDQVIGIFEHILDTSAVDDLRRGHHSQPRQRPLTPSLDLSKRDCVRAPRLRVSFGEYECGSPREWQVIARVLIGMQVEVLRGSMKNYKDIASVHGWHTSTTKIFGLEERLGELHLRTQGWTREEDRERLS